MHMISMEFGGKTCGIVVNVLYYDIAVSEYELLAVRFTSKLKEREI